MHGGFTWTCSFLQGLLAALLRDSSASSCCSLLPLLPLGPPCALDTRSLHAAPASRLRQQGRRIWGCMRNSIPVYSHPRDDLSMLRSIMAAWEQGLVMGSRSCHEQLFECIFSKLPLLSSDLFASYLKGAAVQLPGQLRWHVRPEILDSGSSDGIMPPIRETISGWRPHHEEQNKRSTGADDYAFWARAGEMTSCCLLNEFCKCVHESFYLLLLWAGVCGPPRAPHRVAGQMLPFRGVLSSQLLELIVDANLPLEVYELPVVRALVTARYALHAPSSLFLAFLVS